MYIRRRGILPRQLKVPCLVRGYAHKHRFCRDLPRCEAGRWLICRHSPRRGHHRRQPGGRCVRLRRAHHIEVSDEQQKPDLERERRTAELGDQRMNPCERVFPQELPDLVTRMISTRQQASAKPANRNPHDDSLEYHFKISLT